MLDIEPVSKYRKEAYSRANKAKNKNKELCPAYLNQPYTLQEITRSLQSTKEQQPYHSRQFEDSHLTKFLHEQLILVKMTINLLGVVSILLSLLQSLTPLANIEKEYVLLFHSIITLAALGLVTVKHSKSLELKQKQLIRQKRQSRYLKWFKAVWFQSIVLIVHPNLLADGVVMYISEPVHGTTTPFKLNSLLQILMLSRIYLLYSTLIETSIYCTPRANRMCRIYNAKNQANFGIKSVFNSYPIQSLQVLFVSLVLVLSQMLKLAEENNQALQNFGNAVWCIIITMSTVGYGDVYPISYLGRVIAFCAAISGIILASLLILTLSQKLAMNSKESKSHITLQRLQLRQLLEQYAQETMLQTAMMKRDTRNASEELKKKTERVKVTMRRLKNMVDTQNVSEQINNLFESLYGNLMQIYIQQKNYAEQLVLLKEQEGTRIQEINFTFAGKIEDIIRDR